MTKLAKKNNLKFLTEKNIILKLQKSLSKHLHPIILEKSEYYSLRINESLIPIKNDHKKVSKK